MSTTIKASLITLTAALIGIGMFSVFLPKADANPSAFNRNANCQTAAATSTQVSMSAGNATTTITCDLQYATALSSDSAVLELQRAASSTNSVTNIKFEFSMDAKDWYTDHLNDLASTTLNLGFSSGGRNYSWRFASSTLGAASTSPAGLDAVVIPFTVPTRYVRAIMTVPAQASTSLLWGEITGKKQNN